MFIDKITVLIHFTLKKAMKSLTDWLVRFAYVLLPLSYRTAEVPKGLKTNQN